LWLVTGSPTRALGLAVRLQLRVEVFLADDYVLTTLILASGVSLAGLTTSFRVRFARLLLLGGASLLITYAAD
jgi:hypothetical protein